MKTPENLGEWNNEEKSKHDVFGEKGQNAVKWMDHTLLVTGVQ